MGGQNKEDGIQRADLGKGSETRESRAHQEEACPSTTQPARLWNSLELCRPPSYLILSIFLG